jgi:tRNA pseudouridine synthase 9
MARKGLIPPSTMALTVVDAERVVPPKNDAPEATSNVLTTPCGDAWPRPYYLEDGLRRVKPYFFTYNTHAKTRWRNREIIDIFASEFRDRDLEYYVRFVPTTFSDLL